MLVWRNDALKNSNTQTHRSSLQVSRKFEGKWKDLIFKMCRYQKENKNGQLCQSSLQMWKQISLKPTILLQPG